MLLSGESYTLTLSYWNLDFSFWLTSGLIARKGKWHHNLILPCYQCISMILLSPKATMCRVPAGTAPQPGPFVCQWPWILLWSQLSILTVARSYSALTLENNIFTSVIWTRLKAYWRRELGLIHLNSALFLQQGARNQGGAMMKWQRPWPSKSHRPSFHSATSWFLS